MIISGFPESQLGWGRGRYTRDQANRESVVHGNDAPKGMEMGKDRSVVSFPLQLAEYLIKMSIQVKWSRYSITGY